jgi:hypothetical protein
MDTNRWIQHFTQNKKNRPEPRWGAPNSIPTPALPLVLRSLEQFHLGDGGGPAYLIAINREGFLGSEEHTRTLVDLWFKEEEEHSRLLGDLVKRLGGTPITGHWSFTIFCFLRKWLGVRFELSILLLTEISSTVYYRLLRRYGQDVALCDVCKLILRDEAGHIAFHRARIAHKNIGGPLFGYWLSILGHCAATMLWVNHGRALIALGASTKEFYAELRREITFFMRLLEEERERISAIIPVK